MAISSIISLRIVIIVVLKFSSVSHPTSFSSEFPFSAVLVSLSETFLTLMFIFKSEVLSSRSEVPVYEFTTGPWATARYLKGPSDVCAFRSWV